MSCSVYILLCDQKTFYVGIAHDVQHRLHEHMNGFSPYTKKFSDFQLMYEEQCTTRGDAERRERQIKGWTVAKKKALIEGDMVHLKSLSKGNRLSN